MRDQSGVESEQVFTAVAAARELYDQLRERHRFTLDATRVRVAINGEFAPWEQLLQEGDEVVFLPPVSGG